MKKRIHILYPWLLSTLKIIIPSVSTVVLLLGTFYFIILPDLRNDMMLLKKEMLKELTSAVWTLVDDYNRRVVSGELSLRTAQRRAVDRIRNLRYGADRKDYFWINDTRPRMIMHPYRADLDGKDVSDFMDPAGKHLFVEFVRTVKEKGAGYVDYMWQWKDDPGKIVPKLSYVMEYKPWGWIVGTGIYIDDVQVAIGALTRNLNRAFAIIFVLITLLALYISLESVRREKEKNRVRELFTNIIDFLPDATFAVDRTEKVIAWNRGMERLTGITAADMIGKGDYEYALPFYGIRRPVLVNYILNPDLNPEGYRSLERADDRFIAEGFTPGLGGKGRQLLVTASLLYDIGGNIVGAIESVRDITDRKKWEDILRTALHEKEILLKEVHHRVKNNMQIISSLLSLQAGKIDEGKTREYFRESINRVQAMAQVHNQLYQSPDFTMININDYLSSVVSQLSAVYNIKSTPVTVDIEAEPIRMDISRAIPLGLILNELITNAFKHAFPGRSNCFIKISVHEDAEGGLTLSVSDNGKGIDPEIGIGAAKSLGLSLVHNLTLQLNGTLEILRDGGTTFRLYLK